ncbi:hypothetical protein [Halobellus sp. EA9]|uniref:hypothetical protein n=1 Tax=Halobellus sp. EA9 TaxID=3421647 RepID=UPI003EBF6D77
MGDRDERAEADGASRFEAWTVATFDLAALSLVVVLAAHLSGGLTGALAGAGTVPGLAAFGYLWALVVAAVRWVLAERSLRDRDGSRRALLRRGGIGAAGVGVGLVAGGALVAGAVAALRDPEFLITVAIVGVVGSVVATVVGAVVGAIAAGCNVAVARASERIVPGPDDYSSSSS